MRRWWATLAVFTFLLGAVGGSSVPRRKHRRLAGGSFALRPPRRMRPRTPNAQQWHAAAVPSTVQMDLLRNGLIVDPFTGAHEAQLQWIGLADWEYRTTLNVDAATLTHEHVELVFDGLDTFATVRLNGQTILAGGQHVPPLARAGEAAAARGRK